MYQINQFFYLFYFLLRDENGKAFQSSRHIDKLAIIVIDALRYDFIMSNLKEPLMPFTMTSILKNNSCIITTKAHSPTVTMPRIKVSQLPRQLKFNIISYFNIKLLI